MSNNVVKYECAVDADNIVAVDMHVHLEVDSCGHKSMPADIMAASSKYFKTAERTPSADAIADIYREHKMAAVVSPSMRGPKWGICRTRLMIWWQAVPATMTC